ncbi:MAG: discoidin domain-containing protein [Pirellulales bacterium]|nr:discoidin domain-containing protein [Pirellulales bacterium]
MKSCLGSLAGCVVLAAVVAGAETRIADEKTAPSAAVELHDSMQELLEADWIDRDRRFFQAGVTGEMATRGTRAVTTAEDAAGGCDGIKNGLWGFHVASGETDPWWQVDLGETTAIDRIVVYNRCDSVAARTANLRILVADAPDGKPEQQLREVYRHDGTAFWGVTKGPLVVRFSDKGVSARIVRLQVPGRCSFALDEVEVYAAGDPQKNVSLGKPADQKSVSQYSCRGTMGDAEYRSTGHAPLVASGTPHAARVADDGDFTLAHTRQVVERGKRLAARLQSTAQPDRLQPLRAELEELAGRLADQEQAAGVPGRVRRELYLDARRLARQIAFCNPLLDIDKLLFIKRHDSVGVFHMCDQYYGCNARPGGGLFVLADPFTDHPRLVNLLENSVVANGRLQGQRLDSGAFLSPEVSYDGRTILFAYTQAKAYDKYQGKEAYEWGPEISYHLFKVNADGSGLVQLTDGAADDFDPCFLPNGRIVFVSERRGGYLRCGRHCPVYTMFSMEPDGSDIVCLSFHETHEWQPSVNHDGMLVYSRWDYVDRDTNIAHHIWTCYPDGRDPRSFHGNYPMRRESRPWMEMSIRAVPGSHKYVATTGAHHGHAFGSLVLIDPRAQDDGAMSQLERLTPDVVFPEAEGRPIRDYMCYATAWPLSEDDYLCVYDRQAKDRGIYWVDRDGNRELIYRDPEIACLSPMPLRPRPVPPVIPEATLQTASARQGVERVAPATVAVMNLYDSDFQWPAGTQIKSLRVIQLLPKSTAPPNEPRIGVANQTNARAVLGTVPVEVDGSVFFEAPAEMPIYFQALDAEGLAVQSMRSVTYLHPGERLSCQGCHERKHGLPQRAMERPLALRRAPSEIRPDVAGSNPFSYPRLVQPVLDRRCVGCHRQEQALDLGGEPDGSFTRSYNALAGTYGFYFHVGNGSINTGVHGGSRTIPGRFGARASELLKYLDQQHYGVKLSPEERHRLTLWLDCNSEFLGSYENVAAQLRGEVVRPTLQ